MSPEGMDCARLVDSLLKSDINSAARDQVHYSNDNWSLFASTDDFSDDNTTTLYMDEYFGTFVDFKLLNLTTRIALRVLEDRGLMTRRKWVLLLDEYTNGPHVISNLIAEYANLPTIDNPEEFLIIKPDGNQPPCCMLLYIYITLGTMIYIIYIPAFIVNAFARHSVEHYLQTECIYSWLETGDGDVDERHNFTMNINIEALCSESTKMDVIPYTFTLENPSRLDYHDDECYISDETFEVRQALVDTECIPYCFCGSRCC